MAANIRAVNSSPVAAICQLVGKSSATTRICLASNSLRSFRQSESVKRYSRSTCSMRRMSPGLESLMRRNSSGRASEAPLSFST
jgi:hypothetical protein